MTYVGRFAPSPTGPLHIGSLTTAVASFLHARQSRGEWLVRIEDIDPPREVPGAADRILRALERLDLHWDRSVLYQSARLDVYRQVAEELLRDGRAFRCSCTRKELRGDAKSSAGPYPGTCRTRTTHPRATAVRARVDPGIRVFDDGLQGRRVIDLAAHSGDYVIFRRDGLPAYHLAVVVDDAYQGVTTIVRGIDLLESTGAHLHLQELLGAAHPAYFHVPVVTNAAGQKLSKQTRARAVDGFPAPLLAAAALEYLGMAVPAALRGAPPRELWAWALEHWRIGAMLNKTQVIEVELPDGPKVD